MDEIDLTEWIGLSRSITADDRVRHAPPPSLWASIENRLDRPESTTETPPPTDEPIVIDLDQARRTRAPRARRRQQRRIGLAAAAAAVVAVFAFSLVSTGDGDPTTYVAEATNSGLPEPYDGNATASVIGEDTRELRLQFSAALPTGDPLEVWLIRRDLSDMVSLGLVDDQGVYAIPEGIDVSEFALVDVSVEPDDGDPTHSGRSILRGELLAT